MYIVLVLESIKLRDSISVLGRVFIVSDMPDNGDTGSADVIFDDALVERSIDSSSGDGKVAVKTVID